jgi:hypothetical protein
MLSITRIGVMFVGVVLAGLLVSGGPRALSAKSLEIDFRLLYHAAQLANQAYDGKSAIIGKHPGKSAWVATPGHTHVQYILIHNDKRKIQAIAVRGTVDDTNWRLNNDTRGVHDKKAGILLHRGFRTAAQVIYRDVKPRLKPGYTTYLTGHSLGGAIAGIMGIYLRRDNVKIGGIFTFGQPKFTDAAGARAYSNLPLLRVVYQNDTVVLLPDAPSQGGRKFAHIGPLINLFSGPYYAYGSRQQALKFSPGSFSKLLSQISVPDHKMKWYLKNLRGKLGGAQQVRIQDRNNYIVRHRGGASATTGEFERRYNFNHHN